VLFEENSVSSKIRDFYGEKYYNFCTEDLLKTTLGQTFKRIFCYSGLKGARSMKNRQNYIGSAGSFHFSTKPFQKDVNFSNNSSSSQPLMSAFMEKSVKIHLKNWVT